MYSQAYFRFSLPEIYIFSGCYVAYSLAWLFSTDFGNKNQKAPLIGFFGTKQGLGDIDHYG
jgi:hypothetical protein